LEYADPVSDYNNSNLHQTITTLIALILTAPSMVTLYFSFYIPIYI